MKRSILLVNKFYYPIIGGVESVVKQYAEYLKNDYCVTVLTVSRKITLKTVVENVNDVTVIRCSSLGTYLSMPLSISFFVKLIQLKRASDLVHFHEPFPLGTMVAFLKKATCKYLVTWHSDIVRQNLILPYIKVLQHALCRKADIITTTSPMLAATSEVLRKYRQKTIVLPLSIPIPKKNRVTSMAEREGYLLFIGRLSRYKGISVLLEAYKESKLRAPLVIVGDGPEQRVIRRFMSLNRDLAVKFVNQHVSEAEKNQYLAGCMFLVFPSTERSEAFGIIQLEAMRLKKPVINTRLTTGVPWVSVHGVTGLTVQPGEVHELADAMVRLSTDGSLRRRFGANGYKRVQRYFSDRIVLGKYGKLCRRLLGG